MTTDLVPVPRPSITDWVKMSHDIAIRKGWWKLQNGKVDRKVTGDNNVFEKLMLMVCELAEAAEEARSSDLDLQEIYWADTRAHTWVPYTEKTEPIEKPLGFPIELADVVIRLMDLCGAYGVDLESAMKLKQRHNETRSHRHGNKRA